MTSNQPELTRDRSIATHRMRRSGTVAKSVRTALVGAVLATVAAFANAAPASAQQTVVTIQQVSNARYMDAWEDAGHDYRAVTRPNQGNDTQKWLMTHIDGNVYTIQQVSNNRYLDAHENDARDWAVVTRTEQNNSTQQWLVTDLGGGINTIQQVSSGRYLDAYGDSAHDYGLVTRPFQGNATQQWRITIISYVLPALPINPGIIIPATPDVHASGTFNLSSPFSADFDTGNVTFAGADINYMSPDLINLQIRPVNGAEISYTDGSQRDYAGCWAATYSTTPVQLSTVSPGDYICLKTDQGRITEFRIDNIGALLRILTITYTTWE
jgi:hypothetical protein